MNRFFLVASMTLMLMMANAQEFTLNSVGRTSLKNFGEITNNEVISGYFFFYKSEKVSSGNVAYEVVVLDENLTEIASERIIGGKRMSLVEAAYNGSHLIFKFFDSKEKKISYRTMDEKGAFANESLVDRKVSAYEARMIAFSQQQSQEFYTLYAPDENGFIDIHPYKEGAIAYECSYIGNDGKVIWNYIADNPKGVLTGAYFTAGNNGDIMVVEGKSKSQLSKDYTFSLTAIGKDGKKSYNIPLSTDMYNMMPHNAIYQKETNDYLMVGDYFNKSEKIMKAESQGVYMQVISAAGQIKDESFISWERDIFKVLDGEDLDKAKKYSVLFHDVVLTKDGTIIAIGEQYKKQVSAGGIAMKAAAAAARSAGASGEANVALTEILIGDMMIVELTKSGDLAEVHILDKQKNRVYLPEGYSLVSTHLLARVLKSEGSFDYAFRQFNEDKSVITVGYYDFEKKKGKLFAKEGFFHFASYIDGEEGMSREKIGIESAASEMRVYRGKPGFVLIAEYFSKDRKVELRLEPVNY